MGYILKIGQAYLDFDKECAYLSIQCEDKALTNAPAFGEPTDNSNERWPSYTSWHNFTRFVGLEDLFFSVDREDRLINEHPGHVVITQQHKKEIDEAYGAFYKKYPNCKAGVSENEDSPEENAQAARFEWLKFWVDWALENCEIPIFYNH